MADPNRDLADVLRGLRSDIDGLWGALRRGVGGGGGGGTPGPPGPPAGFGTPGASASGLASGQPPTASVVASGPDTAKVFQFAFGIPAGATGPQGPPGQGGVWTGLPGPATQFRYGEFAGTTGQTTGDLTVNFAAPFPTACDLVICQMRSWNWWVTMADMKEKHADRFVITVYGTYGGGHVVAWMMAATVGGSYIALGH